ncbi:MAG TPA: helix-turn-helix domain-containing protein [Terriglobales bacterium]|jgi:Helix-turn-helix domain|nr:helix-turn-helix domain-containing protein [Terriglobales bacterium]
MSKFLTPAETSQQIKRTVQTLSEWRCTGRYPLPFYKVGGRILYKQEDVDAFLEESRVELDEAGK